MLQENLERRIIAITILLNDAEKFNISNTARSVYYRSAIIQMFTIVEGLVYSLVKKKTNGGRNLIESRLEHKTLHSVPRSVFGRNNIVIASENQRPIRLNDDDVSFQKLNRFLKRKQHITESQFQKLEYVRKERNKIHVQSLMSQDTGYTKAKFNRVSEPIVFLTEKL